MTEAFHRFLAGCLSFLEQRIVIPVERSASRVVRRRVERDQSRLGATPAHTIRVVELRRRAYSPAEPDETGGRVSREVDWH